MMFASFRFSLLGVFSVNTYMSPLQTDCVNVNYYIPEDEVSDQFSEQRWERLRKYPHTWTIFVWLLNIIVSPILSVLYYLP